jgi:hypothetical protein
MNSAAHTLNYFFADGKAQTRTFYAAGWIGTVKNIE